MIETTLTANGSTSTVSWPSLSRGTFFVTGTFGGGTCVLQASRDQGTTWVNVPNASLTANGYANFQINAPVILRVTLSGATSPSLFVTVDSVRTA